MYRITFHNQGKVYEIYARSVGSAAMFGFIEVSELAFGEKSAVVLDPTEEALKNEFKQVKRIYIPLQAVIRIDEVDKQGVARVHANEGGANVTPFPVMMGGPDKD